MLHSTGVVFCLSERPERKRGVVKMRKFFSAGDSVQIKGQTVVILHPCSMTGGYWVQFSDSRIEYYTSSQVRDANR